MVRLVDPILRLRALPIGARIGMPLSEIVVRMIEAPSEHPLHGTRLPPWREISVRPDR